MADTKKTETSARADETAPKQRIIGRPFKPGQSGNPSGRPKGSRVKLAEDFLADIHADWQEHGIKAIERVREEKPDIYLKVVASILPKDLNLNVNKYEHLTDEQLRARIRELDAVIGPDPYDTDRDDEDSGETEKTTQH